MCQTHVYENDCAMCLYEEVVYIFSCLHCAVVVSKTLFIVPTDAHHYKIIV